MKYKFSVIINTYNNESAIKKLIDNLNKEDIQIIIVDTASSDNTKNICSEYQEKYLNIKYIYRNNINISEARNEGFKYADGKYITFIDSKVKLSGNILNEVELFFEDNKNINIVATNVIQDKNNLRLAFSKINKIIDLNTEPNNFVLKYGVFYRKDILSNIKFDKELNLLYDEKYNIQLLNKEQSFGFVCENDTSISIDNEKNFYNKSDYYTEAISLFNEFNDELKEYQMEIILYLLKDRLKEINEKVFEDINEYNVTISQYQEIINRIPTNYIIRNKYLNDINYIFLLMKFKNENFKNIAKKVISKSNINIHKNYIKNDELYFDIVFHNYSNSKIDIIAVDEKNNIYEANKKFDKSLETLNASYGNFSISDASYREFKFNLKSKIVKFMFTYNGKINCKCNLVLSNYSTLQLTKANVGIRHKDIIVNLTEDGFKIQKEQRSYFKYKLFSTLEIYKKYKFKATYRLLSFKNKKYILINDRPTKGSDNGEALFKYICTNRKDLKKYTYFVIDKNTSDYKRLKKIGKVVRPRSIFHKFLFLNAKAIYTSHNVRKFFGAFNDKSSKYYIDLIDYKLVWLQHGITQNDLSGNVNRINKRADFITVVTNNEYNEFLRPEYFYDKNSIIKTGFARYDFLENKAENIITISPTWRRSLSGKILSTGFHEPIENFEKSEYYKMYSNLLNDYKLNKLLKDHNYTMWFVLHPGADIYKNYFKKFENDYIKIIPQSKINYSEMFAKSKLLITDYSSIFFDFAYLKKPLILYQFDYDDFFKNQYTRGYFDFKNNGFGDVLEKGVDVINKIEYYFKNDFKMEEKYIKRVDNTFTYTDKNNCERILSETLK